LDLREVPNTVSDHFIICHGDSGTQVDAILRSVERFALEKAGEKPWHTEGLSNSEWVLLDFVDVVVHIFHKDKRGYYALEDLWGDAASRRYENVALNGRSNERGEQGQTQRATGEGEAQALLQLLLDLRDHHPGDPFHQPVPEHRVDGQDRTRWSTSEMDLGMWTASWW
jgi:ribosome-associated protein